MSNNKVDLTVYYDEVYHQILTPELTIKKSTLQLKKPHKTLHWNIWNTIINLNSFKGISPHFWLKWNPFVNLFTLHQTSLRNVNEQTSLLFMLIVYNTQLVPRKQLFFHFSCLIYNFLERKADKNKVIVMA